MIDVMQKKGNGKSIHSEEGRKRYKSLNNHPLQVTDKARDKWWDEQFAELEKHERSFILGNVTFN